MYLPSVHVILFRPVVLRLLRCSFNLHRNAMCACIAPVLCMPGDNYPVNLVNESPGSTENTFSSLGAPSSLHVSSISTISYSDIRLRVTAFYP